MPVWRKVGIALFTLLLSSIVAGCGGGNGTAEPVITRYAVYFLPPHGGAARAESRGFAISGGAEVGQVSPIGYAAVWSGQQGLVTVIHPPAFASSVALGAADGKIVGFGIRAIPQAMRSRMRCSGRPSGRPRRTCNRASPPNLMHSALAEISKSVMVASSALTRCMRSFGTDLRLLRST